MDKAFEADLVKEKLSIKKITLDYTSEWRNIKYAPRSLKANSLCTILALLSYTKRTSLETEVPTNDKII